MVKQTGYALLALAFSTFIAPAHADQFRLPEEIGRVEGPRDTNIFQVEPTVLDERYYQSGRAERKQFIGTTLPAGAPIPDTDGPVRISQTTAAPVAQAVPVTKAIAGSNTTAAPVYAYAGTMNQFRLPEEISRVEAPRDTNLIQVEPTILNERAFQSGQLERHQNVGITLPYGSAIPDTDAPVPVR